MADHFRCANAARRRSDERQSARDTIENRPRIDRRPVSSTGTGRLREYERRRIDDDRAVAERVSAALRPCRTAERMIEMFVSNNA